MPVSFGNDEEALEALQQSSALTDLSHWDRLHISGTDRLTFLHGQVHSHMSFAAVPTSAYCRHDGFGARYRTCSAGFTTPCRLL